MMRIDKLEGVGPAYAKKLNQAGIRTVRDLLRACGTPEGRKELAQQTGIDGKLILRWTNMADLFRIRGIGPQYAELLEAAGVDTVPELAQRNPENLYSKLAEVNAEKRMVKQLPTLRLVRTWVEQARKIGRRVYY